MFSYGINLSKLHSLSNSRLALNSSDILKLDNGGYNLHAYLKFGFNNIQKESRDLLFAIAPIVLRVES